MNRCFAILAILSVSALSAIVLSGCEGTAASDLIQGNGGGGDGSTAGLTGTWVGTYTEESATESWSLGTHPLYLVLSQANGQVTGTLNQRTVTGTLVGNQLVLNCSYVFVYVNNEPCVTVTESYDGTVNGGSYSGTFSCSYSECPQLDTAAFVVSVSFTATQSQ